MIDVGPLIDAIRRGDTTSAGDLLAAHPDVVNSRDAQGNTPLLVATYGGRTEAVRLLLDRGADRSLRTGDGQTALEIADERGRVEAARLLRA
jgi:uncharacterized protein